MKCLRCNTYTKKKYKSEFGDVIYLCDNCSEEIHDKQSLKYREFLEELTSEFGKLMSLSQKAFTTNKNKISLSCRKQSILVRSKLKEFRKISLEHEKYLKKQKEKIDEVLKNNEYP